MFWYPLGALSGLFLYSWFVETRWYRIHRKRLELTGASIPSLRILHLSDFHFFRPDKAKSQLFQRLANEPVDFIFMTGDLIDNDHGTGPCLDALKPFQAQYGIYTVLGNHDYSCVTLRDHFHSTNHSRLSLRKASNNVERLIEGLQEMGIVVLRNERREIEIDGVPISIAGVDDPYTFRDDIQQTFDGFEKHGPLFVLVHSPDRHNELMDVNADMVFSGHTHGGQVQAPFIGPIVTRTTADRCFADGLVHRNGTVFHTTRGVGSGRIARPRFFCRPEVTFFEVHFQSELAK